MSVRRAPFGVAGAGRVRRLAAAGVLALVPSLAIPLTAAPAVAGAAPGFVAPTPAQGWQFVVEAGTLLSFAVKASDTDAGDSVTITAASLPSGATLTRQGSSSNPAEYLFSWTPTSPGKTSVTFVARDASGVESLGRTLELDVTPVATRLTAQPALFSLATQGAAVFASLSATLARARDGVAMGGFWVDFYAGSAYVCSALTSSAGLARCGGVTNPAVPPAPPAPSTALPVPAAPSAPTPQPVLDAGAALRTYLEREAAVAAAYAGSLPCSDLAAPETLVDCGVVTPSEPTAPSTDVPVPSAPTAPSTQPVVDATTALGTYVSTESAAAIAYAEARQTQATEGIDAAEAGLEPALQAMTAFGYKASYEPGGPGARSGTNGAGLYAPSSATAPLAVVQGQQAGLFTTLGGTARDLRNQPVAGVAVDLLDPEGYFIERVITGSTGGYSFPRVGNGDYRVRFSKSGYRTQYFREAAEFGGSEAVSVLAPTVPVLNPGVTGIDARLADTVAPETPRDVRVTRTGSANRVTWTLGPELDRASYEVLRSIDGGTRTTLTSTPLSPSTTSFDDYAAPLPTTGPRTYTYFVVAKDLSGNPSGDGTASITLGDPNAPATPSGLSGSGSPTGVALQWSRSGESDVTGYRVQRSAYSYGPYVLVATVPQPPATQSVVTHADAGAPQGQTSHYVVSALDSSGNESARSASVGVFRPDSTPPAAPTGLTASATTTAVDLQWQPGAESDLVDHEVLRATSAAGPFASLGRVNGTSYRDTAVTQGATYWYAVRAIDSSGNRSSDAVVQVAVPDQTPPPAPAAPTVTTTDAGLRVAWQGVSAGDLAGYRVARAGSPGGPYAVVSGSALLPAGTTSFVDSGVAAGQTYYYVVRAVDASGNSAQSPATSAVAPGPGVGPGTYQEGSAAVGRTGDWVTTSSSGASGGAYATTSTGSAAFRFRGTAVRWLARTGPSGGLVQVHLDGVGVATIDLYSATPAEQQVRFERSGLALGDHVLRITGTGTRSSASSGTDATLDAFVNVDATPTPAPTGVSASPGSSGVQVSWQPVPADDLAGYQVLRATGTSGPYAVVSGSGTLAGTSYLDTAVAAGTTYSYVVRALDTAGNAADSAPVTVTTAVGAGTHQESSPAVQYTGSWASSSSASDSGGASASTLSGSTTLRFRGSSVKWITRRTSDSGIVEVLVDGVVRGTVDAYASSPQHQQALYSISNLAAGDHTITIRTTGGRNALSSGTRATLDAFVIS